MGITIEQADPVDAVDLYKLREKSRQVGVALLKVISVVVRSCAMRLISTTPRSASAFTSVTMSDLSTALPARRRGMMQNAQT